ncbi:MFS transporter [Symbiobacterium thermophilum]|uniref:MFS transporter n=1 Tax=Symbiobacterium thermophilum TaxID=2734 RepID=UPI0035C7233D
MPRIQRGTREYQLVTLALFLGALSIYASLYVTQPILPLLSADFGITPAQASLSVSTATISMAISQVLVGPVADSLGRKPIMTVAVLATGVIGLVASRTVAFGPFLFTRFLQGLVMAGLPATAMAYLAEEIDPQHLGAAMGLYISGNSLGGLGGRIISGSVAEFWGWRGAVAAIGVVSLVCALWFARALPPSRNFRAQPLQLRRLVHSLFGAVRDPLLRALYLVGFMAMGSFVALYNYVSYHLMAPPYSLSAALVGWIFLLYLAGTFSSALMGRLSDQYGRAPMLALSLGIELAGAAIALAGPLLVKIGGIAVFTFGFFGAHSIASSWVGQRARHDKGAASALYLFTYYMGASIAGTVAGLFWMRFGWPGVVGFIACLLATAVGLAALARKLSAGTETVSTID